MPKVSIILTSRNHEKFIEESIQSVLSQTYEDFEFFIWDDASGDNSWQIIKKFNDKRIKACRNDIQKRGIAGINAVISTLATGEFIAIHHSDDIWEPSKLADQVAFLERHSEYGAVFTNVMPINEVGNKFEDESHFYKNGFNQPNRSRFAWLNHFFYYGNALCHPSALVRKSCYDKCGLYRYGLAQLGDLDMWMRICSEFEIYVLPAELVRFRVLDFEANASGNRLLSRIRQATEQHLLINNYLRFTKKEEVEAIFPDVAKLRISVGFVAEFEIAMSALKHSSNYNSQLFGIELLYKLINDPQKSAEIIKTYGFGYMEFIAINGREDFFAIEAKEKLREEKIAIQERDQMLQSISWKITSPLRGLNAFLKNSRYENGIKKKRG